MPKYEEMTQEDVDKMQNRIDESNAEAKKFREQRDEFKAQAESGEANVALKSRALKAEAKLQISVLGVKDPDRIVKYLDLSAVEFDDDGNLSGLDTAIDTVKADFPELFDAKRRVGGKVDSAANQEVKVQRDPAAEAIDRALGIK